MPPKRDCCGIARCSSASAAVPVGGPGGRGNAGAMGRVENQNQVSHPSHSPLEIPQMRRDFHIRTAPACAWWKSGKPTPGFPLSTRHTRLRQPLYHWTQKPKKGSRPLRGLLIRFCRSSCGRAAPISCSSFDWKMLQCQRHVRMSYLCRIEMSC